MVPLRANQTHPNLTNLNHSKTPIKQLIKLRIIIIVIVVIIRDMSVVMAILVKISEML
jgi:hypothetical protein